MRDPFRVYDALSQALRRAVVLVDLLSAADPNDLADDTRGQACIMALAELRAVAARADELYALAGRTEPYPAVAGG